MHQALRAWLYLGSALLIGSALFPTTVGRWLDASDHRDKQRLALWVGAALVMLIGFAQAPAAVRAALGSLPPGVVVRYLTTTRAGWMTLARVPLATALLASGLAGPRFPRASRAWATLFALALLVSISLVGHAGASGSALLVFSDVIHMAAALYWVGAVTMLAWLPRWQPAEGGMRAAAASLSRTALWLVGVVLATGIAASVAHLTGIDDLVTTPYGRTLLLKHALFLVVIALAALHRVRGLPLFFDEQRPARFRGAVRLESLVLLQVLAVTGALTSLPPPHVAPHAQSATARAPSGAGGGAPAESTSPPVAASSGSAGAAGGSASGAAGPAGVPPIWQRQFGSDRADDGTAVAVRPDGSLVVVGYTDGSMPGATSAGASDIFVAAFDAGGKRLWLRQLGGAGSERAVGVATDATGDAYVAGFTNGSFPGTGGSHGAADAFLVKLGPDGSVLWARQFGSPAADFARGVALDATGNVLVGGDTRGALPGNPPAAGAGDAFVAKFDASGDLDWMREFGGPGGERVGGIAVDAQGDALVSGTSSGTLPTNSSQGQRDVFVAKLGPNGRTVWVRQLGSPRDDFGEAIATDAGGASIIAGYTYGALPGNTSSGGIDGYIAHVDADGNLGWVRQFGVHRAVFADAVAVAPGGDVVVAGWADADPFENGSGGHWRVFVAKFGPQGGQRLWLRQFGESGTEEVAGVAVGSAGTVMVASSGVLKPRPPPPGESLPESVNDVLLARYPP